MTEWFSRKLNQPVRVEMKGQEMVMIHELKNIKEGAAISDSLFELPSGMRRPPSQHHEVEASDRTRKSRGASRKG